MHVPYFDLKKQFASLRSETGLKEQEGAHYYYYISIAYSN